MTTATATANPATAPAQTAETLWGSIPLEIIGGTGEVGMGKSLFGLTICPGPQTRVYDNEGSCTPYKALGFEHVDIAREMMKAHQGRIYRPIDRFNWWANDVRNNCPPGKYRVIMLDPVSEIEEGLVEFVKKHPAEFGYTASQFQKGGGLLWAAVKNYWSQILDEMRTRCETFYFTAHKRSVWEGNSPVRGKREAKGKDTLRKMASLYLDFDRPVDKKGNQPEVPSAVIDKGRVSAFTFVDGKLKEVHAILPPNLPVATPDAIREYINNPADYSKLKATERIKQQVMSDDERLMVESQIAENQRETAQAEVTKYELMQRAAEDQRAALASSTPAPDRSAQHAQAQIEKTQTSALQAAAPNGNGAATESDVAGMPASVHSPCTNAQVEEIKQYAQQAQVPPEKLANVVTQLGHSRLAELSYEQACELTHRLSAKASEQFFGGGMEHPTEQATEPPAVANEGPAKN